MIDVGNLSAQPPCEFLRNSDWGVKCVGTKCLHFHDGSEI